MLINIFYWSVEWVVIGLGRTVAEAESEVWVQALPQYSNTDRSKVVLCGGSSMLHVIMSVSIWS